MLSRLSTRSMRLERKQQQPPRRTSSSHVLASHQKDDRVLEDHLVRQSLADIEANSDWEPPISHSIFGAGRIFNACVDPILRRTGNWILPEDPVDIPIMFESYLNILTIYYSLVGVLSAEASMYMKSPNPTTTPTIFQYTSVLSRFCWVANTTCSFAAVVSAFHLMWALHATPAHVRRQFVLENPIPFSAIYALGAPNFVMTLVAAATGALTNAGTQPDRDIAVPATIGGIALGLLVTIYFALSGGYLLIKAIRPWKQAFDKVQEQSLLLSHDHHNNSNNSLTGDSSSFSASINKLNNNIPNDIIDQAENAGLTLAMMKELDNEVLLDKLLLDAGIGRPGDRVQILLAVRQLR